MGCTFQKTRNEALKMLSSNKEHSTRRGTPCPSLEGSDIGRRPGGSLRVTVQEILHYFWRVPQGAVTLSSVQRGWPSLYFRLESTGLVWDTHHAISATRLLSIKAPSHDMYQTTVKKGENFKFESVRLCMPKVRRQSVGDF